jgi:uncharacterized membrane protein
MTFELRIDIYNANMAVRYRLMLETTRSTQKLTTITTMGAESLFVVKLNRLVLHYYFPESSFSCPPSLVLTSTRRIWQWDIDWCSKRQGSTQKLTSITTMGESLFVVKLNRLVLHKYFPESGYSCPSSLVLTSTRRIWQWDIDWCSKRQGRHKNLPLLRRWVSRCSLSNLIGLCSTSTSQNPAIHVSLAWYGHLSGEYGSEISDSCSKQQGRHKNVPLLPRRKL